MPLYIRIARIPAFLLVLIVSVPTALAAPGSEGKPNIVLVVMGNFGYGEIGVYGGDVPQDRILDGVDQSDFLTGKSKNPLENPSSFTSAMNSLWLMRQFTI